MSIFSIFTLLGGLAFFIYGMNQMSHNLEIIAGEKMEAIINKLTSNRFLGLLLGCVITIAIQSSSAVTVMLVGLVNSGLMDLSNTVGIIMGSNIGTTVTAWIMKENNGHTVRELESRIDTYEDRLGTYLIKLSGSKNTQRNKRRIAKMLHSIGDWERISDYARDLTKSALEIKEKKLEISEQAKTELKTLSKAVAEIVSLTTDAFVHSNAELATKVEPLEQVIDLLVAKCRENHIRRLQDGVCTLERGFAQ